MFECGCVGPGETLVMRTHVANIHYKYIAHFRKPMRVMDNTRQIKITFCISLYSVEDTYCKVEYYNL